MDVLGKVPFRILIHVGAVEMLATILLCYSLAVAEGHVKPWLPTISACGESPLEVYPFRLGIAAGAMLLGVEALGIYGADKSFSKSKLVLSVGLVAAFCLGVVAVVSSREWDVVHTTAAVIFFVLEDVLMVLLTVYSVGNISRCSLGVKAVCSLVGITATAARLVCLYADHGLYDADILLAIVEWTNTFVILGFHWSLAIDFPGYYLADVKETSVFSHKKLLPV